MTLLSTLVYTPISAKLMTFQLDLAVLCGKSQMANISMLTCQTAIVSM